MTTLVWLVIALPLAGAAILLLAGRRSDSWGHLLGCLAALASFAAGVVLFVDMLGRHAEDRVVHETLFSWVPVGGLQVDFGLQLDALSMCFVLLITGVGSLIHIYSIGYMAEDPERRRFFAYLNLFLAAMLLLVLADNYLGLYVGWEGVGLASYLLIGFWSHKPSAATAAKKAFVVNRVGDMGLAIALMVMFAYIGSISFAGVFSAAPRLGEGTLTAIGLLLLLAACGKSAQVPLQSWLGDAMEGPTPVSALIHAATMVTAGVYLIVRSGPVFNLAPNAQLGVVIVGAVTLLFGAIVGCAKDDIKKALAASTMSQIGYMVLAAGLGPAGYAFAIMHLLTHGFFKAGLFLGAGSVMHAMNDEVNMRRYGGLRKALPITFATFGLGYLAIIGVPPLAGFFSKDGIIEAALGAGGAKGIDPRRRGDPRRRHHRVLHDPRDADDILRRKALGFRRAKRRGQLVAHPHESPAVMTWPMILLAVGSVASGGAARDRRHAAALARTRRRRARGRSTRRRHGSSRSSCCRSSPRESRSPTACTAREPSQKRCPHGSRTHRGRARRISTATHSTSGRSCGPGSSSPRVSSRSTTTRSTGPRTGWPRCVGRISNGFRQLQTGFARSYALSMLAGAALVVAAILAVQLW